MHPIYQLFQEMVSKKSSDLHLSADNPPILRVHGEMAPTQHPVLSGDQIAELVRPLISEQEYRTFLEKKNLDFSITVPNVGRFRGNLLFQNRGISAVFRAIPYEIPSLEKLGAPEIFYNIAKQPTGLVLVTGPTGSGKSTTLAAIIDHINAHESVHILSIEDPIEFVHPKKRALVTQREVGPHSLSFADALRAALREDPDVILVGEMRDLETISLAMTAAETGHLVFGTLHTNSAIKTVDRILDSFPGDAKEQVRTMLSESLRAVIAQRLLPKADGAGRVACYEVLVNNRAISNLIRENKTFQIKNSMLSGRAEGMKLMDQSIMELFKSGQISGEVAYENAEDRTPYQQFAPRDGMQSPAQHAPAPRPLPSSGHAPMQQPRTPEAARPMPETPRMPSTPPSADGGTSSMSPLERLRRLKKTG